MGRVKIRSFNVDKHLCGVLQIEENSFDYPWTNDEFKTYKYSRSTSSFVAEYDDRVVGYLFYEARAHHYQISNLAVVKDKRRSRVASELILRPMSKLAAGRRDIVKTHIREDNLAAQLFFKACGFIMSNIIRQCFDHIDESAYEMVFRHGWPIDIKSNLS